MVRWVVPQYRVPAQQNLIYSAGSIAGAARCGIRSRDGFVRNQHGGLARRKREMVEGLHQMHVARTTASGVELIMGEGRFVAPRTVEIALDDGGTRRIFGERVFLVVGSRATMPNIPGLAAANPMTYIEALDLDRLPAHLIVIGSRGARVDEVYETAKKPRGATAADARLRSKNYTRMARCTASMKR